MIHVCHQLDLLQLDIKFYIEFLTEDRIEFQKGQLMTISFREKSSNRSEFENYKVSIKKAYRVSFVCVSSFRDFRLCKSYSGIAAHYEGWGIKTFTGNDVFYFR